MKLYNLDYTFLIEDAAGFGHVYEFEKVFADFLASRGLEAQIVKPIEGSSARGIMLISKKEIQAPPLPPKFNSPKQQLKKFMKK